MEEHHTKSGAAVGRGELWREAALRGLRAGYGSSTVRAEAGRLS